MFIATKANPWNEKGKLRYCTWANVKTWLFWSANFYMLNFKVVTEQSINFFLFGWKINVFWNQFNHIVFPLYI